MAEMYRGQRIGFNDWIEGFYYKKEYHGKLRHYIEIPSDNKGILKGSFEVKPESVELLKDGAD